MPMVAISSILTGHERLRCATMGPWQCQLAVANVGWHSRRNRPDGNGRTWDEAYDCGTNAHSFANLYQRSRELVRGTAATLGAMVTKW